MMTEKSVENGKSYTNDAFVQDNVDEKVSISTLVEDKICYLRFKLDYSGFTKTVTLYKQKYPALYQPYLIRIDR